MRPHIKTNAHHWLHIIPGTLLLLVFFVGATPVAQAAISVEQQIVNKTNQFRLQQKAGQLKVDETLRKAAQARARDMLKRQYFGHVSPTGKAYWNWLGQDRYRYSRLGENIARNRKGTSNGIVQQWINSPGHRANMLDPNYTLIGVGAARGQFYGRMNTIAVQIFGTKPRVVARSQ